MDVGALLEWYERVRRPLPWRATRDPYALLVSEVMLQQTQALRVVPYYERWLAASRSSSRGRRAGARGALAVERAGYNRRRSRCRRGAGGGRVRLAVDLTASGRGAVHGRRGRVVRVGRAGRGGRHQRAAGVSRRDGRRVVAARARRAGARCCRLGGGDVQPGDDGARRDGLPPRAPSVRVSGLCGLPRTASGRAAPGPACGSRTPTAGRAGACSPRCSRGGSRRSASPRLERALAGLERDGLIVAPPTAGAAPLTRPPRSLS